MKNTFLVVLVTVSVGTGPVKDCCRALTLQQVPISDLRYLTRLLYSLLGRNNPLPKYSPRLMCTVVPHLLRNHPSPQLSLSGSTTSYISQSLRCRRRNTSLFLVEAAQPITSSMSSRTSARTAKEPLTSFSLFPIMEEAPPRS